jgi:hypothetical protein
MNMHMHHRLRLYQSNQVIKNRVIRWLKKVTMDPESRAGIQFDNLFACP